MTLEQQYPKFYSHPERYLGIEVERMCNHAKYIIDYSFLNAAAINKDLHEFTPKFKPQQGEQFIKDLEDAVRLGSECKDMNYVREHELFYEFEDNGKNLTVLKDYLSQVLYCIPYEGGEYFDTAVYVDRMRELGYYI